VNNRATTATDPSGLWIISRNFSKATAVAKSEAGDNFAGLAQIVGLDIDERKKWLKPLQEETIFADGTKYNPQDTLNFFASKVAEKQEFSIPNTVYCLCSLWPVNRFIDKVDQDIQDLRTAGFHVVQDTITSGNGKGENVIAKLKDLTANGSLHGFWYAGHGAKGEMQFNGKSNTCKYATAVAALGYKLALVVSNACNGEDAKGMASSSPGAIFYGAPPFANTYLGELYHVRELFLPHDPQGTKLQRTMENNLRDGRKNPYYYMRPGI
jgi:hypothetical protein